jgi:hypothetical protein
MTLIINPFTGIVGTSLSKMVSIGGEFNGTFDDPGPVVDCEALDGFD